MRAGLLRVRRTRCGGWPIAACVLIATLSAAGCVGGVIRAGSTPPNVLPVSSPDIPAGIRKIRHVIIITQENRSFDEYFGTFPRADGIPMRNGRPAVCVPDVRRGRCQRPYHNRALVNGGGPHGPLSAVADINGGRMDGFLRQAESGSPACLHSLGPLYPMCSLSRRHPDVMGYHTGAEIPNYWAYARHYVLQDHMFSSNLGWSLPAHLYAVSAWSARCRNPSPMSCTTALGNGIRSHAAFRARPTPPFRWTDLTYLLHRDHVSWRYYVHKGRQPDCASGAQECHLPRLSARTPGIWNPLPKFTTNCETSRGSADSSPPLATAPSLRWRGSCPMRPEANTRPPASPSARRG
jgi:phospholipase C